MSDSVGFVWHDSLAGYDFGEHHPLSPLRVQLAKRLVEDFGLLDRPNIEVLSDLAVVDEDTILGCHDRDYVSAVKAASDNPTLTDLARGLGTGDVPTFLGMHEASMRVCSATLTATRAVAEGRVQHAVNFAGGLHHAMPDRASGFCVYNDIAIGIHDLLDHGVQRVAYVDVDAHHGDGVEKFFWDDPRVLTISLHESGRTLFPGTGFAHEVGSDGARGSAVNVALPAGVGDAGWLRAFSGVVPDLLEAFDPQILFTQQGCDSHFADPLTNMTLSVDGQRQSYKMLHDLAHEYCEGRWIALGGGGYDLYDVVPRAWTHLMAIAAGAPIAPATEVPGDFREYVRALSGEHVATHMTDGRMAAFRTFDWNYSPEDAVDKAIMATREAVFPFWGLVADPFGSL